MHQAEVFDHICQETEEYGLVHARMGVVEYQKCLYDIVPEGEINLYAQDEDGLPAERDSPQEPVTIHSTPRCWCVITSTD